MKSMKRWRGLLSLVADGVEHGSLAIERIQKETARLPFEILEHVPTVAAAAKGAHALHDASVSGVHGAIRLVTRAVRGTIDVVLIAIDDEAPK